MCYYDILRRSHDNFPTHRTGWRNNNRTDRPIPYLDTLIMNTRSESIEAIVRWRRILLAGVVVRMEYTSLPKSVMIGKLVRVGAGNSVGEMSPGRA